MRFFGTLAICTLLFASALSEHEKHHHHNRHNARHHHTKHHGHHAKHHAQARADVAPVSVNLGGSASGSASGSTTAGGSGAQVSGNSFAAGSWSLSTPRANLMHDASMDFYAMHYPETATLYIFRPDRNLAGVFNTNNGKAIIMNTDNGNSVFAPALPDYVLDRINSADSRDLPGAWTYAAVAVNNIGEAVYGNNKGPGSFPINDLVNAMKAGTITDAVTNDYIYAVSPFLDQLKNMPYKANSNYATDFVDPMIVYMDYMNKNIDSLKNTRVGDVSTVLPGQVIQVPTPNYIPSGQLPVVTKVVPVKEVVTIIKESGSKVTNTYNQYVDQSININNSTVSTDQSQDIITNMLGNNMLVNPLVSHAMALGPDTFLQLMSVNPVSYINDGMSGAQDMVNQFSNLMNMDNFVNAFNQMAAIPQQFANMGMNMFNQAANAFNPLNFLNGMGGSGSVNGGVNAGGSSPSTSGNANSNANANVNVGGGSRPSGNVSGSVNLGGSSNVGGSGLGGSGSASGGFGLGGGINKRAHVGKHHHNKHHGHHGKHHHAKHHETKHHHA